MLAVLILGALASSCSKDSALFEPIPSDSEMVGVIRAKAILEQAGCKFEGGKAVVPEELSSAKLPDLAGFVAALDSKAVCDFNQLAIASKDGRFYMTMLVDSKDKFVEAAGDFVEWTDEENGYKCGLVKGGGGLLLDENRVWFTSESADRLKKFTESAGKGSVTALSGVMAAFDRGNLVDMAARQQNAAPSAEESRWATVAVNIKDNKITYASELIKADGATEKFEGVQPINPAVLGYIAPECTLAFAAGLTKDVDWSMLEALCIARGGFQAKAMLGVIMPYLQSIDGTVMFAAGPANDQAYTDMEPGNWRFIAMVHMPQEKINEIIGTIRTMAFRNGISLPQSENGVITVQQYGMDLHVGNVDGYLAVSNYPFSPNHQNSLAPVFEGKNGAAVFTLPSFRLISPTAPAFGIDCKLQCGDSDISGEVSLKGTNEPILFAIFKAFA